jgi:Zn-dependent protease
MAISGRFEALSANLPEIAIISALSLICAGTGFLFHEIMHKIVAQASGFEAEYRNNHSFTPLSLLAALAGWILLAPGAVYISGMRPGAKNASGLIALAGPATNLALAFIFRLLTLTQHPLLELVGGFGYNINIWLAAFNMVPGPGFDGQKVWAWSKTAYFAFVVPVAAAFFLL